MGKFLPIPMITAEFGTGSGRRLQPERLFGPIRKYEEVLS
jgi:hypothetical protein